MQSINKVRALESCDSQKVPKTPERIDIEGTGTYERTGAYRKEKVDYLSDLMHKLMPQNLEKI